MISTGKAAKKRKVTTINVGDAESEGEGAGASTTAAEAEAEAGAGVSAVGRLVDSSQADDRRMIRLVRERRLLYARNNMPVASYYSQVKKLWQEVANKMGWSVADVRRKWSHIRNSYSRHLRNEMYGVCTSRGRIVSKWYLADELAFLRDHMATDTRPSRYSYTPLYLKTAAAAAEEGATKRGGGGEAAAAAAAPELQPFLTAPPWLGLAAHDAHDAHDPRHEASSTSSFEHEEESAYFQFFRSIHPDYRELPVKKQRTFRRECLNLMHRLLDEGDARSEEEGRYGSFEEQEAAVNLSAAASDEERAPPYIAGFTVKQEPVEDMGQILSN